MKNPFIIKSVLNLSRIHKFLTTEGKLILVPIGMSQHSNKKLTIVDDGTALTIPKLQKDSVIYKPIIISETEKIEVGDWVYNFVSKHSFQVKEIDSSTGREYLLATGILSPTENSLKIIALPEHFSPKYLHHIVYGKINDGDKLLIECEKKHDYILASSRDKPWYQIKLDSSNHITIHSPHDKTKDEFKHELKIYVNSRLKGITNDLDFNLGGKAAFESIIDYIDNEF